MEIGNVLREIAKLISSGLGLSNDDSISIQNVSFFNDGNLEESNIVMSLVSVEEEKSLRYAQTRTINYPVNGNEAEIQVHNPVVFLNLFIMFSFHRPNGTDFYMGLNQLGRLVRFLQNQYVFTSDDLPGFSLPDTQTSPPFSKVVFELYSLSFEQMNHLWGVLGGKYIPSVVYKVRLFPIKETPSSPAGLIKRQRANFNNI